MSITGTNNINIFDKLERHFVMIESNEQFDTILATLVDNILQLLKMIPSIR